MLLHIHIEGKQNGLILVKPPSVSEDWRNIRFFTRQCHSVLFLLGILCKCCVNHMFVATLKNDVF